MAIIPAWVHHIPVVRTILKRERKVSWEGTNGLLTIILAISWSTLVRVDCETTKTLCNSDLTMIECSFRMVALASVSHDYCTLCYSEQTFIRKRELLVIYGCLCINCHGCLTMERYVNVHVLKARFKRKSSNRVSAVECRRSNKMPSCRRKYYGKGIPDKNNLEFHRK